MGYSVCRGIKNRTAFISRMHEPFGASKSHRRDLNPQPTPYEGAALPLSYGGKGHILIRGDNAAQPGSLPHTG